SFQTIMALPTFVKIRISRSLNVKASPFSSPSSTSLVLSPGNSLTLMCGVTADNLPALSLEVSWLADGREIITMDRSGVVISNTSSSGAQGKKGEASLERTEAGDYRLAVRGVSNENGGNYTCRIRTFINQEGRRWYMTAEKTSNPVTVKVSEISECFPQCFFLFVATLYVSSSYKVSNE
uniref:Ig-like domain-containing protein n=2 Tax=Oreochromis TaxID=8139 RepID=A0A669BGY0_ORENI